MIDKDWLIQKFVVQKLTLDEIGVLSGTDRYLVNFYRKKYGILPRNKLRRKFEVGQKVGEWTLINNFVLDRRGYWKCKCSCGYIGNILASSLGSGSNACRKCHPSKARKIYDRLVNDFYWKRLIKGAEKRKIEFNLTREYIEELLVNQNMKCALSGQNINIAKSLISQKNKETTASLDRIDNKKPYIEGNVQWVHKDVNMMKFTLELQRFIDLCEMITKNKRKNARSTKISNRK